MCQRLRVAMKVGPLDGQEFYQLGDSTFVAIKWRRRNANAVEFASFGDVSQVKRIYVVTLRSTVTAAAGYGENIDKKSVTQTEPHLKLIQNVDIFRLCQN